MKRKFQARYTVSHIQIEGLTIQYRLQDFSLQRAYGLPVNGRSFLMLFG